MRLMTPPRVLARIASVVLVLAVAGCAGLGRVPLPDEAPASVRDCATLFERVERSVMSHGVRDDEAHVLEGHPWLRSNRFLASFRESARGEGLDQWLSLLARVDRRGRSHELANLPEAARGRLGDDIEAELSRCRDALMSYDSSRPDRVEDIREAAEVPDAYIEWRRVVGIYPISGWFLLRGVKDWQTDVHAQFAEAPDMSDARYYVPPPGARPDPEEVAGWLDDSSDNPLGIPLPGNAMANRLFRAFAPVYAVETEGPFDRPGVPQRGPEGVTVRPEPVIYGRISHTRLGDRSLLQLNYLVWFSARPRSGPFDMLGGRLDGVYWRVTLGADGSPLLYDSMHACGCYHMAFPSDALEPRPLKGGLNEPLVVPRQAPAGPGRMVLYLAARTHYLVGIGRGAPAAGARDTYGLRSYHELRSLSGGSGLFGEHGIVPGTDRREELFLWPAGVRAPGAMRQWGTHATAFVGERHFDEPYLIERYFRLSGDGNRP